MLDLLNILDFVGVGIDVLTLLTMGWIVIRIRSRRPMTTQAKALPPENTEIDIALRELLEKSRGSGGRVHIHDVEETIRRRLG